jgi:hypothetical protein
VNSGFGFLIRGDTSESLSNVLGNQRPVSQGYPARLEAIRVEVSEVPVDPGAGGGIIAVP